MEGQAEARLKPLDEVKAQIEPILKQQKAAAQAQSLANTVQTWPAPNGMDKAAADKGLTVTTTDLRCADRSIARRRNARI